MPMSEIEIICVDDGSTDTSREVIETFAAAHPELAVHYFWQEHTGGPATGRNRALAEASGEYLYFVDADDYLGDRALEEMYRLGQANSADIVIGPFVGVRRGVPKHMFRRHRLKTSVFEWNVIDSMNVQMFRTDYVRSMRYRFNPDLRMAEDHPFTMNAYLHTSAIAVLSDVPCYYWVRHPHQEGLREHLTSADLKVEEFLAYIGETFAVIEHADLDDERQEAIKVIYWRRLLTFDLFNEGKRDREPYDRELSFLRVHELARAHSTPTTLARLEAPIAFRLRLILNGSSTLYTDYLALAT